jgi:hypothetical protein
MGSGKSVTYKSSYGPGRLDPSSPSYSSTPSHTYILKFYGAAESPTHFEFIGSVYERRRLVEEWDWHAYGEITTYTEDFGTKQVERFSLRITRLELRQSKMDSGIDIFPTSILAVVSEKIEPVPCRECKQWWFACHECEKIRKENVFETATERKYSHV